MFVKNVSYMLVLGTSIVDIFGFCRKEYKKSDSIPGKIKMSFGGVSRNIAENMARVGVNTKYISIIGDDETGRAMLEHSQVVGYDMSDSLILKNGRTPTYMAILNEEGELESAVVDIESANKLDEEFIDSKAELIENATYTFLDTDFPEKLEYILKRFYGKTKFILDPISSARAEKVKHLIKFFHTVKPNRAEAEVLLDMKIKTDEDLKLAAKKFLDMGVENVFISLDADGIFYASSEEMGKIKACDVEVLNVTGAGDSFVAGLGYGYRHHLSMRDMVRFAITMSVITISSEETIHPDMCFEIVDDTIEKLNWEETKY